MKRKDWFNSTKKIRMTVSKEFGMFSRLWGWKEFDRLWSSLITARYYNGELLYLNYHHLEDSLYIQIIIFTLHVDASNISWTET
jgi:hypothetical protein